MRRERRLVSKFIRLFAYRTKSKDLVLVAEWGILRSFLFPSPVGSSRVGQRSVFFITQGGKLRAGWWCRHSLSMCAHFLNVP